MRVAVRAAGVAALLGCCGCASSGLDWVRGVDSEAGARLDADTSCDALADGACAEAGGPHLVARDPHPMRPAEVLASPERTSGPPRLEHTITLGETLAAPVDPRSNVDTAGPEPAPYPVYLAPQYDPYFSSSYGWAPLPVFGASGGRAGRGSGSPSRGAAPAVRPGMDWPAPRSFGPAFPFHTAPGSAWSGRRR